MTVAPDSPRLDLTAAPHLAGPVSTPGIMWTVTASLAPVVFAAAWFFGPSAFLVIAASVLGCVAAERAFGRGGTLRDGSAVLTGVLLALTLPPGMPLWMAFLGGVFGVGLGKCVFGGLGQNVFNPALLGRAFLQAAFPAAITTWPVLAGAGADGSGGWWSLRGDNLAWPFTKPDAAATVTSATPLGLMKFEGKGTGALDLFLGRTGGSLGETSDLAILLCGAFLALRGMLNWRTPVAVFAAVALVAGAIHLLDASRPGPLAMLFSGGLALGAVYMATDPVTSPMTNRGCWIFGASIGVLVVAIRLYGGLPEGVMYAILLMNAVVPYINRATQPRVFGTGRERAAKAAS